jgi:hypothetical protein
MRSYALLRELVRDCGGTLVEDQLDGKNAKRRCAVFVGRTNIRYRLCWDKKESCGTLQVLGPDANWEIASIVRKRNGASYTNLRSFMDTAERLAGRRLI